MSARDNQKTVAEFVVDTSQQLDVTGWWPRNGPAAAQECTLADGQKGAEYSYDHWAPVGTDLAGDAQRVATYWESLGMTVQISDSTKWPTVYGEGGPVLRASFDTGAAENSYRIGVVSTCAAGDFYELNEEDRAARAAGEVLPGDEGVDFGDSAKP